MDKVRVTPKDFFLWLGTMFSLYVGVYEYIQLVFNYINYAFPNSLSYYPSDPYDSGISWEMATLIVFTPLFLVLMWYIHRSIKKDPSRAEVWIRRWALYLTLFVAGVTIAVDLIWVLYAFLNGTDLTEAFLLKAFVVLAVTAIGFMHFLADLWGYWKKFPTRNSSVASATGLLVLLTIVSGFFIVGTPQQAQQYRLDSQRVQDLQSIQSEVVSYWQEKGALPASLSDLTDSISGWQAPVDPVTGAAYVYKRVSPLDFQLCATFAQVGDGSDVVSTPLPAGGETDNWTHGAGQDCFDRSIDPSRYPPLPKATT